MPFEPKDISGERLMALACALEEISRVQEYLLERVAPTDDRPHKEHKDLHRMKQAVNSARNRLQVYFLGD